MTYSASVIKRIPLVFFLEVKKCLVVFNLPVSRARPKKLCNFFFWLQLRIKCKSGWISQAEKRYCVSKGWKSTLTA